MPTDLSQFIATSTTPNAAVGFDVRLCIIDTITCAYLSRSSGRMNVDYLLQGTSGNVPVWWAKRTTNPRTAAFMNSFQSHEMDYDSIHYLTLGHPSAMIVPALFSVVDDDITVSQIVDAVAVGVEVMALLAKTFGVELRKQGIHPTASLGALAAVAAVARLTRASPTEIDTAMTFASSAVGYAGTFGTLGKPFQVANATALAIDAIRVATSGASPSSAWTNHLRILSNIGPDIPIEIHSEPWALQGVPTTFKERPICGYFEEIVTAVDNLECGSRSSVHRITISIPDYVARANVFAYPRSAREASFSLGFLCGLALRRISICPDSLEAFELPEDRLAAERFQFATIRPSEMDPAGTVGQVVVEFRGGQSLTLPHRWGAAPLPSDAERYRIVERKVHLCHDPRVNFFSHKIMTSTGAEELTSLFDLWS